MVAVAAKNGWVEDVSLPLRVATKYVNIAQSYYLSLNRQIDIIKLNGAASSWRRSWACRT